MFSDHFTDEVFIARDRLFQRSISFSRGFQKLRICMAVCCKKNTQIVTTLIKVRLKPRLKPTSTDWATRRENSLRGPVMGPRRFRSIFCEPNYVSLVWIGCMFRGLIVPRSYILEPSVSTRLEHQAISHGETILHRRSQSFKSRVKFFENIAVMIRDIDRSRYIERREMPGVFSWEFYK